MQGILLTFLSFASSLERQRGSGGSVLEYKTISKHAHQEEIATSF
jgi:hypothetical protein